MITNYFLHGGAYAYRTLRYALVRVKYIWSFPRSCSEMLHGTPSLTPHWCLQHLGAVVYRRLVHGSMPHCKRCALYSLTLINQLELFEKTTRDRRAFPKKRPLGRRERPFRMEHPSRLTLVFLQPCPTLHLLSSSNVGLPSCFYWAHDLELAWAFVIVSL